MKTIRVTDDLILEIHDGDPPALHLHNADGDGVVVVRPSEIRPLRDALAEAAGVAVAMVTGEHNEPQTQNVEHKT